MIENLPRYLYAIQSFLSDLLKLANGKVTLNKLIPPRLLQAGWRDELKSLTHQCGSISISFPQDPYIQSGRKKKEKAPFISQLLGFVFFFGGGKQ